MVGDFEWITRIKNMTQKYGLILSFFVLMTVGFPMSASATQIGSIFHDYGIEGMDPGGNDPLSDDYVTIKDNSGQRFYDSLTFPELILNPLINFP